MSPACRSRTAPRRRRRTPAAPGAARRRRRAPRRCGPRARAPGRPATRHAQTSSPSNHTEHEPHSPCSHAFFDPGRWSSSRRNARGSPLPGVGLARLAVHRRRMSTSGHHRFLGAMLDRPSERAAGENAERVPPVRRRAANVIDRTRGRGDPLGEASATAGPSGAVEVVPRPDAVRAPGEVCLGVGRPHDRRRHRSERHPYERVAASSARHSAATEITIALRVPIFEKDCGPASAATAPRGSAHPPPARSASHRRRNSCHGSHRSRRRRRRARSRRRTTARTGRASPAGEAVPRLPPTVPRLRICGEPTVREASASAADLRELPQDPRVRDPGAEEHLAVAFVPRAQLGHAARVERSPSGRARSKFSATIRSVPPAIGDGLGMGGAELERLLERPREEHVHQARSAPRRPTPPGGSPAHRERVDHRLARRRRADTGSGTCSRMTYSWTFARHSSAFPKR